MSWHGARPRPITRRYPNGTDWRCECGFSRPDDDTPREPGCPECGAPELSRIVADFNVAQPAAQQ